MFSDKTAEIPFLENGSFFPLAGNLLRQLVGNP